MGKKSRRPNNNNTNSNVSNKEKFTTSTTTTRNNNNNEDEDAVMLAPTDVATGATAAANAAVPGVAPAPALLPPPPVPHAVFYPSDGPCEVELLQTTSETLQHKLNTLTELGVVQQDRTAFVHAFVPLDLSSDDTDAYLQELTTGPEADSQWTNLISEIAAIRCGKNVDKIDGDQRTIAIFHFEHRT